MKKINKIVSIVLSATIIFSAVGMTSYAKSSVLKAVDSVSVSVSEKQKKYKDFDKYISIDGKEYNMFGITGIAKAISFAGKSDENKNYVLYNYAGYLINSLVSGIASKLPDAPGAVKEDEFVSENFYSGNDTFINEAPKSAYWSLGYANASLVPSDWQNHEYFLGGYIDFNNNNYNRVEDVLDDMKVRIIALDDSSKRGVNIFATIDCIGISSADIKDIRSALATYAAEKGIKVCTINVYSTHCHSCIDTQGLWTNNIYKLLTNLVKSVTHLGKLQTGVDAGYMDFLKKTVSDTMIKACTNMERGHMTYAVKDIGDDYFTNKNRPTASSFDTKLTRLVFTPDNKEVAPTIIANIGAHPYVAGLSSKNLVAGTGRELSGDYVYYWGDTLAKAGYNFMFFNGAIAGIYEARGATNDGLDVPRFYLEAERYGVEMAKITLGLTKTQAEIEKDPFLVDKKQEAEEMAQSTNYTKWYEDWQPVSEKYVDPILNIKLKEVKINVTNPLIQLVGKLNMVDYDLIIDDAGNYKLITEIGYMEIGKDIKIAMVPGELCPDIAFGGTSLSGEYAFNKTDFNNKTIAEIFDCKDITMFGLANDAIGYIVPDNDYARTFVDGDAHYHETISIGKDTASTLVKGFEELAKEIKR